MRMRREHGATLMIALVFLVIMALLGVTVANVTTMEERMAGHTRDRDLALQAAEAALRDAETRLGDATDGPAFRAAAIPFVATRGNDSAFWEDCFKGSAAPCTNKLSLTKTLPTGAGAVAEEPKFILERKPDSGTTQIYRVTARGVGGTANAVVILQAEFGY
jgi:type IV pilus assembly protein PilX